MLARHLSFLLTGLLLAAAGCIRPDSPRERAFRSLDTVIRLYEAGCDSIDAALLAPALAYFPEKGDAGVKGRLWYQSGWISYSQGAYDKAVVSFEKALLETRLSGDRHLEGLICRAMADTYNQTYNSREDTAYLRRAWVAFGAGEDSLYRVETALRLAAAYMNDRQWKKAGEFLDQVVPVALRHPELYAPCMNILASYELDAPGGDPAESVRCFLEALAGGYPLSDDKKCDLGYALYLSGRREEALLLWETLEKMHPEGLLHLKFRQYQMYSLEGDVRRAMPLLEESALRQDSILRVQTSEAVSRSQRDYQEAVAEGERLQAARERDRRRAVLAGGILLALLLSMVGFILWREQRDRLLTLRRALEESESMVRKLSDAEHRHLNRIHSLSRTAQTRQQELEDFRAEHLFLLRDGFRRLGRLFEDRRFAETQAQSETVLYRRVGEILKAHLGRPLSGLRKDIPSLKEKDILLFCYLVIGYDAPLISVLMDTGKESTVYTWKNRLLDRIRRLPPAKARRYLDLLK